MSTLDTIRDRLVRIQVEAAQLFERTLDARLSPIQQARVLLLVEEVAERLEDVAAMLPASPMELSQRFMRRRA